MLAFEHQRKGMVLDIRPVSYVLAVAIDRQGSSAGQLMIICGISFWENDKARNCSSSSSPGSAGHGSRARGGQRKPLRQGRAVHKVRFRRTSLSRQASHGPLQWRCGGSEIAPGRRGRGCENHSALLSYLTAPTLSINAMLLQPVRRIGREMGRGRYRHRLDCVSPQLSQRDQNGARWRNLGENCRNWVAR